MATKSFTNLAETAAYMLGHDKMKVPVVMLDGKAYNTAYLKMCIEGITNWELRVAMGQTVSPMERFGLEVLQQIFEVDFCG